jgi:thiol-disulfide isomerase/thioredoxin
MAKPTVWMLAALLGMLVAESSAIGRDVSAYGSLYDDWETEIQLVDHIFPDAPQAEKRDRKRRVNADFTPRFVDLAREHRDDDDWVQCLIWVTQEGVPGPALDDMFRFLRENGCRPRWSSDWQLGMFMSQLIRCQSDQVDPALRAMAESNPKGHAAGTALFALAARVKIQAEREGRPEGCAEAEKLLERVIAEFPNCHTYRGKNNELAAELLEELRSPVAITRQAPEIEGRTLGGEAFRLSDTIRGKVAVISFSAHWCSPCVAMHPVQKEILTRYSRDDVVIIELNGDAVESLDKVRRKMSRDGLAWIVISEGTDGPNSEQWQVSHWPTYFIVDREGRIRRKAFGNVGRSLVEWVDLLVTKPQ